MSEAKRYEFNLTYKDKAQVILWVEIGMDPKGQVKWCTVYRNTAGNLARLCRSSLPIRATRDEAQADLDKFANEKGLRRAR